MGDLVQHDTGLVDAHVDPLQAGVVDPTVALALCEILVEVDLDRRNLQAERLVSPKRPEGRRTLPDRSADDHDRTWTDRLGDLDDLGCGDRLGVDATCGFVTSR